MTGNHSRRKGQRAQLEVLALLRAAGFDCRNIGLYMQPGPDISVRDRGTVEVKRRRAGYGTAYRHLGRNWALFIRDDSCPWLVIQTADEWLKDRAAIAAAA